jgi:hypothetical protein
MIYARSMRRPLLSALVAVSLIMAVPLASAAPAPVAKNLRSTLTKLKAKTTLPIVLPSVLPVAPLKGKPLYPEVTASAKRWDVVLGYVARCDGANVCAAGNLSGVKTTRKLNAGDGKKVMLRHGAEGRFQKLSCGASCAAPSISFKTAGLIFTYQLKLDGSKTELTDRKGLIAVANSALAAGPR